MASGTTLAFVFMDVLPRTVSMVGIVSFAVLLTALDLVRIRWPALNRAVFKVYGPLMRRGEETQPSAQVYYMLGLCWAMLFLPKVIALQAILTLAWMDPVAALYGVRFGRRPWNNIFRFFIPEERRISISLGAKTIEGSFAGFLAAFLAGVIAWTGRWIEPISAWQVLMLGTVGGVAAVIAEAWPSQWDDNAKIPFWTGLAVWAMALLLGIPLSFA